MDYYPEMTCMLRVNVNSLGWENALRKVLRSIEGVSSVTIDGLQGTATVTGRVNPDMLLKTLAKAGRQAQLYWVQYGNDHRNLYHSLQYGKGYHADDYYYGYGGNDHSNMYYLPHSKSYSADDLYHHYGGLDQQRVINYQPYGYGYDHYRPVAHYFPQAPATLPYAHDGENINCCRAM